MSAQPDGPVRCVMVPRDHGVPLADAVAAATGVSVYEWSLCIDDNLVRGTE